MYIIKNKIFLSQFLKTGVFLFLPPRYEAIITVVKPSTRILSIMYYAREPGKIKYALFPFKSIFGGKYIFKKSHDFK